MNQKLKTPPVPYKLQMRQLAMLISLLLVTPGAFAQQHLLKFDHFTQQTGMPDQQIQFVKQDDQGYVWFGTLLGLVRYDGYNLKRYAFKQGAGKRKDIWLISSITDTKNDLWFSTLNLFGNSETGLLRYNRKTDSFLNYPYSNEINSKELRALVLKFADAEGNLWGLYGSLGDSHMFNVRFDPHNGKFFFYGKPASINRNGVRVIIPIAIYKSGGGGTVWMADSTGLSSFSYKDRRFHPFWGKNDAGAGQFIRRMYQPPSEPGMLWLNTVDPISGRLRLARLNTSNKKLNFYDPAAASGLTMGNDSVNSAYEDTHGRLWFATQNGLMLFDRKKQAFSVFLPPGGGTTGTNRFLKIVEANNGLLWILAARAIFSFDPATHLFQRFDMQSIDPQAVATDIFRGLMLDRSGILWVYSDSNGIHKFDPAASAFQTYPIIVHDGTADQIGFTDNMATTADGFCWYTNNLGAFKWKPGSDKPQQVYQSPRPGDGLDAVFAGKDGKLYFDNRHGLTICDTRTGISQNYTYDAKDTTAIGGSLINSIIQDHTGLVWIGTTSAGVCTFNPATKKFKRYPVVALSDPANKAGRLDSYVVDCIYEDRHGDIWVGTHLGGLNRFNRATGKFTSYYMDGKLNVYTVTHLLDDNAGHFWVGTYSLGLFEFDRKTGHYIRHIDEDNGLLFNTVTGIVQDEKGYLWISSVRGLTRIDTKTMGIKTYPLSSILPGKSLISDHNLVQVNNRLALVLTDGVAVFNPRSLDPNPYPPQVHIEKVSYSAPAAVSDSVTTKIAWGAAQLDLPHNENRVTFSYVGLHFADPAQNKYTYMLQGFDHHWIDAGNQRSVTYTNLPPGTYTFFARAANSDGVWNYRGDSFVIVIYPPWWLTWWAWFFYIIVFITAVYLFVAYQSRKLIHDKRVLEHKVQVRTEEVMQQKEEIEAQRDNLEKAYGELKTTQTQLIQSEKMASLGELTAGIAHEIQNPLNFVNNFSEVSAELVEEMQEELNKGEKEEAIAISEDIKQNLEKIRHHGRRADAIVKGMLEHSRSASGQKEPTDINQLADEYLRLSYHGLRAKDKSFNAELVTHFDENLPKADVVAQDIGRVLLNLFNNAFYAVHQKAKTAGADYKPTVEVSTAQADGQVIISVKDNGPGIPDTIKDKIMQPFFTTKPTGEGTGLGLSLSYDIVVKGHGGKISVESYKGTGSEFTISIPI